MRIQYEKGICSNCERDALITHKTKNICETCRLKSNKKPIIRRQTNKLKTFSEKGKKRKQKDIEFYRKVWNKHKDWKGGCICEECGTYLSSYKSNYVSHILSRGAYPELAHIEENANILCEGLGTKNCHNRWETGDKKSMKIYKKNKIIIENLKNKSL